MSLQIASSNYLQLILLRLLNKQRRPREFCIKNILYDLVLCHALLCSKIPHTLPRVTFQDVSECDGLIITLSQFLAPYVWCV